MNTENYKDEMLELIKQNTENQEQEAVENQDEIVENTSNDENQEIETSQEEETKNNESQEQKLELNLDKELSGLPKELIEAVKTFKDPEDREKAIKIAKEQRAREDRLHLQLGNTKKELENVSGLLKNIETNPAETFKALANKVGFDLNQLAYQNTVQDELYLTPEEQIEKKAQIIQQNSYKLLQEEVNKRESKELLAEFLEDTSHSEELIANYQQEFINFYNYELQKNGIKDYYPLKTRKQALETAYAKLERLQPDYEEKVRAKILNEVNGQKKEKFDEAKKQQKISKPVSNAKPMTYEEEQKALIRKYL
ncbi:MAG: hypothetical protein ACO25K_04950 [Candidatus Fonsibacter ubiquis]